MTESDSHWVTAGGSLATAFARHTGSLRGVVRRQLVHRGIVTHVPRPCRVLDIGGGTGVQARMLARVGYEVTLVDPDPAMLERAAADLAVEDGVIRDRVRLVQAIGEEAVDALTGGWDLVCCHAVITYLPNPQPLLEKLVEATAVGGVLSILVKNAAAGALRPALQGSWADALATLDAHIEIGNLGAATYSHHLGDLAGVFSQLGAPLEEWYGVRVATDHLGDTPGTVPDADQAVELEWELGRRDPYRACARLLHLICRRTCATIG